MSAPVICETCGHANPAQATFCESCKAFFWDATQTPVTRGPAERTAPLDASVPAERIRTADSAISEHSGVVESRAPRNESPTVTRRREAPVVASTRRVVPTTARLAPRRLGDPEPGALAAAGPDGDDRIRAVMPGSADDRSPEAVASRPSEHRRLDDQMCAVCGGFSRANRRFCRCGATLREQPAAAAAPTPSAGPMPRGRRDFRAAVKATGAPRPRWSAPLEPAVVGMRGSVIVLAVVALLVGLTSQAAPVRRTGLERLRGLVGAPWKPVPVSSVGVSPAAGESADGPAGFATDKRERAWLAPWPADAVQGAAPCIAVAGGATLVVGFAKATSIGRIVVTQAKPSGATASAALPAALDVAFSDGTCTRVVLAPGQAKATATTRSRGVQQARVTIAAITGSSRTVAVGDIAFQKR